MGHPHLQQHFIFFSKIWMNKASELYFRTAVTIFNKTFALSWKATSEARETFEGSLPFRDKLDLKLSSERPDWRDRTIWWKYVESFHILLLKRKN